MGQSENHLPVYLDQNAFSALQQGKTEQPELLEILKALSKSGAIYIYSMVHVEECRASSRPKEFAAIIDDLPAYLIEPSKLTSGNLTLVPNRARELILAKPDITDQATKVIEDLVRMFQFTAGWLGQLKAHQLMEEVVRNMDHFWSIAKADVPDDFHFLLQDSRNEMADTIGDIPLGKYKCETELWQSKLRDRLPRNYAQLDDMPAEDVVTFIISCFDNPEQKEIRKQFPKNFWSKLDNREEGKMVGFAFMLFMAGLIRDSRVKKKDRKRRERHFLAQFRDCQHIENASYCVAFVTFDKGAARLAKSAYSYAGVATEVVHLTAKNPK